MGSCFPLALHSLFSPWTTLFSSRDLLCYGIPLPEPGGRQAFSRQDIFAFSEDLRGLRNTSCLGLGWFLAHGHC